jgi:hypothetical protein
MSIMMTLWALAGEIAATNPRAAKMVVLIKRAATPNVREVSDAHKRVRCTDVFRRFIR